MKIFNNLQSNLNSVVTCVCKKWGRTLVTVVFILTVLVSRPDMTTAGDDCMSTEGDCNTLISLYIE